MKTLIALDGSIDADKILNMVANRDWPKTAIIKIVMVVGKCAEWDEQEQFINQSKVILDSRIENLRKKLAGMDISGTVHEGRASVEILHEARRWKADRIIIGSHGDTGVRPDDCSVAAEIVNNAPCTVEILKLQTEKV